MCTEVTRAESCGVLIPPQVARLVTSSRVVGGQRPTKKHGNNTGLCDVTYGRIDQRDNSGSLTIYPSLGNKLKNRIHIEQWRIQGVRGFNPRRFFVCQYENDN